MSIELDLYRWLRSSGYEHIYLCLASGRIRVIKSRHWCASSALLERPIWEEWPELYADGSIKWEHPERVGVGTKRETAIAFKKVKEIRQEERVNSFQEIFGEFFP